jgi:hypothetical protein
LSECFGKLFLTIKEIFVSCVPVKFLLRWKFSHLTRSPINGSLQTLPHPLLSFYIESATTDMTNVVFLLKKAKTEIAGWSGSNLKQLNTFNLELPVPGVHACEKGLIWEPSSI